MRTIYKFQLSDLYGGHILVVPFGFKPLSVGAQNGRAVVWGEIADDSPKLRSQGLAYFTGYTGKELPVNRGPFLGTVEIEDGIVLHFYFHAGKS